MEAAEAISLSIEGMSCASCVGRVERTLEAVPGVTGASVNFATERAFVQGSATSEALIAAVAKAGYAARPIGMATARDGGVDRRDVERRGLIAAALLTAPVFAMEMGSHLIPGVHAAIERTLSSRTAGISSLR